MSSLSGSLFFLIAKLSLLSRQHLSLVLGEVDIRHLMDGVVRQLPRKSESPVHHHSQIYKPFQTSSSPELQNETPRHSIVRVHRITGRPKFDRTKARELEL